MSEGKDISIASVAQCPSCHSTYTSFGERIPRNLRCGHTACHDCLSKSLESENSRENVVRCTVCKTATVVPLGIVANLPTAFVLIAYVFLMFSYLFICLFTYLFVCFHEFSLQVDGGPKTQRGFDSDL
jgi:hypothetical protein